MNKRAIFVLLVLAITQGLQVWAMSYYYPTYSRAERQRLELVEA